MMQEVGTFFFLFISLCVEDEVVVLAPGGQCLDLLPVASFNAVGYESYYGCVIRKFDEGVGDWTENTALGDTGAESD